MSKLSSWKLDDLPDFNCVAGFAWLVSSWRMVLVRTNDDLAIQRMFNVTFDQYGNGLVHLVRHNFANQRALEPL
jgi:hypothetical protein